MARVRDVGPNEVPEEARDAYQRYASDYGPFRNQVGVFAHVPSSVKHLMGLLLELREQRNVPRRLIEIAIVAVSKLNGCDYCVAHHKPLLTVEGISPDGIDRYSARALARVWQAMRFSWSLTTMMHRFPGAPDCDRRMQDADLALLEQTATAQRLMAENYTGLPY